MTQSGQLSWGRDGVCLTPLIPRLITELTEPVKESHAAARRVNTLINQTAAFSIIERIYDALPAKALEEHVTSIEVEQQPATLSRAS